ncbi:hypothetical protein E1B28_009136 [Marasmius oreades]|uniref:BTB domain-containing protein n=1 Tax=Marasmius oreades TaxID=181124 RepID=A0A9P7S010_9AGAR|nr:uncharacterized protein E1B28_009136 [Marasmius oreades]KAG7092820.1 hypothetical protein E1B28_009136 [Marasmius oreades]
MTLDNKTPHSIKRLEIKPPISSKRCREAGKPSLPNYMGVAHIDQAASSTTSSSFSLVPKPFPPPSLAGIPLQYVLDQLHLLAPHYWDKPTTADCTLVIPVPYPRKEAHSLPFSSRPSYDPSGLGRRVTEPSLNFIPRLYLKLHTDYLSAHSSFLRGLFSGASPFDLSTTALSLNSPLRTSSGRFIIPADRLPHLLPASTPEHPVLFLPVPDPTSIDHLIHWMYFGETSFIERDLCRGTIEWEGIARNVEYLGLSSEIKVFLGRWYGRWLHPERRAVSNSPTCVGDEDEDSCSSDTLYSEDDLNDDYDNVDDDVFYDSASDTENMDTDLDCEAEKEPPRGRSSWNHRWPPSWNFPFATNETANHGFAIHPPAISPLDTTVAAC